MRSVRSTGLAGIVVGLLAVVAPGAAAQGDAVITVAQDGSGDFDTIAAALEAAADGDTIRISPGTYVEGLLVAKDISLVGDGRRDEVIVSPGVDEAVIVKGPINTVRAAIHFVETNAIVQHVSFEFLPDEGVVAWSDGGAVTFADVSFSGAAVALVGGEPRFSDTVIDAYFAVRDGASPTVVDSEIIGHASVDGPGRTVIRDSLLHGGTSASADATGAYEGNHFIGQLLGVDSGSDMLVQGNLVEGVEEGAAIEVVGYGSSAEILDNTIRDSVVGISIDSDEPGTTIIGNTISDVRVGIHLDSEASVLVKDNTIEDAETFGLVFQGSGARVADNSICGSGEAFEFRGGANPEINSNQICAALAP